MRMLRLLRLSIMKSNHSLYSAQEVNTETSEYVSSHGQNEYEARFLALLQDSSDIYWFVTPNEPFPATTSPKWESFTGQKMDAIPDQDWLSYIHPQDRQPTMSMLQQVITSQRGAEIECRIRRCDGIYRVMHLRYVPVYNAHGGIHELIAYAVDITTTNQLQQISGKQDFNAAMKMNAILESISDAFFSVDTEWRYTYVNAHAEKLLGQSFTDLVGQRMDQGTSVFADLFFLRKFRKVLTTGEANHFEGFAPPLKHWFEIHAYPTPDGMSIYARDITERKHTEQALRDSELKFRRFVESNIIGVMIADIYGNIYEANNAYLSLTGYTLDEITKRHLKWTALTIPEFLPRQAAAIEEFLSTGISKPFEMAIQHKDGTQVPIMLGMAQLKSSSTRGVAIVMDISARKAVEQQKDVFLSITSHELRTPLTIIKSSLQIIQRRMRGTEKLIQNAQLPELEALQNKNAKDIKHALRQTDIQVRMVNDLLDMSRIAVDKLELNIQRNNLTTIVTETVEDLRSAAQERTFLLTLPPEEIYVQLDPDRIGQVISNYITNAIKYSGTEHPIRIGLAHNKTSARFWVQDEGPGLSKETQKYIWNRFYQAKDVSPALDQQPGLGLGLYICQTIIKRLKGEVGVESEPGKGSTFWFTLPLDANDEH